jgi:hypothetical protein
VQWRPHRGERATHDAIVRVLFDERTLYFGARLPSSAPDRPVVALVHRRDLDSPSDWFGVQLDSVADGRTAFAFFVNAANVQRDFVIYGDGAAEDASWEAVWESAVTIGADGWSVELAIPLAALRLRGGELDSGWGFNFERREPRSDEVAAWAVPPRERQGTVSAYPRLLGLEGVEPVLRREWAPYAAVRSSRAAALERRSERSELRAGLDARFGVPGGGQVDLTVNPDFSQVERDASVLNLSTIESFFDENRPFFLEGLELFRELRTRHYHSRRIGQSPPAPALAEGERLTSWPLTEIMGAAKYTGKFDSGFELGLVAALVDEVSVEVVGAAGERRTESIAPETFYAATRGMVPFGESGSFVSALFTRVDRAGEGARDATVGSIDAAWSSASRRTTVDAGLSTSRVVEGGRSRDGWRGHLGVRAATGAESVFKAVGWHLGREFDPNDLGYLGRADEEGLWIVWEGNRDRETRWLRNGGVTVTLLDLTRNLDGDVTWAELSAVARAETAHAWSLEAGVARELPRADDRELRTHAEAQRTLLEVPGAWRAELVVSTPRAQRWSAEIELEAANRKGGPSWRSRLSQTVRPSSRWELALEASAIEESGERRWLTTITAPDPTTEGALAAFPIVGLRRLELLDLVARTSFAWTPALTFQLFVQSQLAAWRFRDLRTVAEDGSFLPEAPPGVERPEVEFGDRRWVGHLVGRWEFRPGSMLHLVLARGAAEPGDFARGRGLRPIADLEGLFGRGDERSAQLKLAWLFR